MPKISAKYNPLKKFVNISEVSTRITSAISASGEGQQFKDFAWKFLNIVAMCLQEMGEPISNKSLAFFITRPKQLLLAYCDKVLPAKIPRYHSEINKIIDDKSTVDKQGNTKEITRAQAVALFVIKHVEAQLSSGKYTDLQEDIITDLSYVASLSDEYCSKITASLGPVFDKINKTSAGEVFSWEDSFGLPEINLEEAIKRKQVIYVGLDSMSNKAMAEAIGQALIADLVSLCGRMYKENSSAPRSLYLHADEFAEIVRDEFIILLNKAGGAGIHVTAYTQTVNDLGVAFGSSKDKPKMLLGNFGTMIMLKIANLDTARTFTECLEGIQVRSATPASISNDRSNSSTELFTTTNMDHIGQTEQSTVVENDLFSLPKGQAFVMTNGGELFKVRIPLPKNDGSAPPSFEALMSEVNLCYAC